MPKILDNKMAFDLYIWCPLLSLLKDALRHSGGHIPQNRKLDLISYLFTIKYSKTYPFL